MSLIVENEYSILCWESLRCDLCLVPIDVCKYQVGEKSLTAREGSLSRTMKSSFSDLCVKYEDIRTVDRMAAVQVRVY